MTDPNNPYLNAGASMLGQMPRKPAVAPPPGMDPAQFQRQQQRTALQNDRTAMQQVPQANPLRTAGNAMGQMYDQLSSPLQAAQPAGPPPVPVPAPAQPPTSGDVGGQIGGAPAQVGRPPQRAGGFNPRQMVTSQGQARGAQMERMARPSGARRGFAQAQQTGNIPGGPKPPKSPTY